MNKAMSAAGTIGHGLAIAHGIREAAPVVMGAIRTAGSLLPYLAALRENGPVGESSLSSQ